MGSNGPNDLPMSAADETEDSVEIKIKTLDSQTYTLRVNKFVPVPALKEQIATVTGVVSEQQRLICRGRVLSDDQLLSAYHVEDGHTLHLVSRPPMSSSTAPSAATGGSEAAASHEGFSVDTQNHGNGTSHSFVFEAVNVDPGDRSSPTLGGIISSLLHSIATGRAATANARAEPGEMSSDAGHSDARHPQPSSADRVGFDANQSAFRVQQPMVITDSLTTIQQYLGHMRDQFRRGVSRDTENSGAHVNGGGNHSTQDRPVPMQGGLASPASLAALLLSTRELLRDDAGEDLSQLARRLENQATMTDPMTRANVQSSALRSGLLLQNMGSLLLELGRTTMTLHMGQTPTDAVVNAGPAVFISASGPNPLMVQPVPFYPGSSFDGLHTGTANSSSGSQGPPLNTAYIPRNIEIEIHTGRRVSPATTNLEENPDAQQTPVQADATRNPTAPSPISRGFYGSFGGASMTEEPGVRVVPLRTVVALPTRAGRSTSDSSGRPTGVFVPLFARVQQHQTVDNAGASRPSSDPIPHSGGSQPSSDPHSRGHGNDRHPNQDSSTPSSNGIHLSASHRPVVSMLRTMSNSVQDQGNSRVFISGQSPDANNSEQTVQGSVNHMLRHFDQWFRNALAGEEGDASGNGHQDPVTDSVTNQNGVSGNAESQEPSIVDDQAIFFSNMVRQLMPYISSQGTGALSEDPPSSTTRGSPEESPAEPSSSQHDREPAELPSPKRTKRG